MAEYRILHRDPALLALEKPAGISLLADRGGDPCLWDEIKTWCGDQGIGKPRLVHRLDKGTSGVLLVALTAAAQSSLTRQFTAGTIWKSYVASVAGTLSPSRGVMDLPLRPGRKSRYRVAGLREDIALKTATTPAAWRLILQTNRERRAGHASVTQYRVLSSGPDGTLVLLQPQTGRTHQLRVHLSWIGHPIRGDRLYGRPDSPEQKAERLMLHCRAMTVECDWEGAVSQRLRVKSAVPFAGRA